MKTEVQADANVAKSSVSERRSHLRRNVLFSCAELGAENGGIVLDISESGLALQAIAALADDNLPKFRFQFAPTYSWIDTKVRIAWKSESKMMAGVEFIDLPEAAREQIRTWAYFTGDPGQQEKTHLENGGHISCAIPVSELISGPTSPKPRTGELCAVDRGQTHLPKILPIGSENMKVDLGTPIRGVGLLIAGTLFVLSSIAFFFLRPSTNTTTRIQKRPEMAAELKQRVVPPSNTAKLPSFDPKPSSVFAANLPGLLLQVGAMKHEENAEALADSLRQNNFPVIVSRSGDGRFYRVVVGPYRDIGSTLRIRDQLRQRGVDAFRMPWDPPGR